MNIATSKLSVSSENYYTVTFQSAKIFQKLRLRAFQPYHQILCVLKHFKDVQDRSNTHKGCNAMYVKDIKTSHNRFLTDFLEFISLLLEMSKMCMNYNVDSNTKSSITVKFDLNP